MSNAATTSSGVFPSSKLAANSLYWSSFGLSSSPMICDWSLSFFLPITSCAFGRSHLVIFDLVILSKNASFLYSDDVTNVIAIPLAPALPVRPILWT